MTKYIITNIFLSFIYLISLNAQETALSSDTLSTMSGELSEIVIKASKDNVTYKSIPASVSVISSAKIKESEILALNDLTATAPNFFMPDYGSKLTSPVYIRGIGSRINSPSVGLYVDYVPYFEKAAFNFDFFDIQRIEVLRGPQGTLFGRNTMGGIINIVTTSPLDYQGSHINLTAGNFGSYAASGGHYGKAGSRFGFSIAGNLVHNDGFYTNSYTGDRVDELNSTGARSRLIYEISDRLSFENIAAFEISRQGGYPYAIFNDSLNAAEDISYNQYSSYNRNLFSDAFLIRYTGNNFEVLSTSSYQFLDDKQSIDQDFTADSLYFIVQDQNQNMFSQEIIIRSSGVRDYKWLFGGYAFYQAFDNAVGVDAYVQQMNYLKEYDHKISGAALFHQSSIDNLLVKNLTVTAGIRVDFENDMMNFYYDRTLRGNYSVLADTVYPVLSSLEILPRFALNYRIKYTNIYAVIARGYKTGGFNSTFERPEDLTFDPEYSWNYEAGVKTSLIRNYLFAEIALFYIDWKNQQIYQTVPSGRGSMLKNAGHSFSRGGEVSLRSAPVRGFDFMLAYGYTDARFITYVVNSTTDNKDNYLPYVPRHTIALQAGKSIDIKNSSVLERIRFNAIYRGTGEIYWDEENSQKQPYYGLLDLKVSFIRRSVQADIWTKNLLNADYSSFYFEALGNKYVQKGKPVQIGLNLSIKF